MLFVLLNPIVLSFFFQRDSPDDSMKTGAGMVQDKRMDMGSMVDFNGVMGKNPGSRHQLHKESAMDRSPYYDKVCRNTSFTEKVTGTHFGNTATKIQQVCCASIKNDITRRMFGRSLVHCGDHEVSVQWNRVSCV